MRQHYPVLLPFLALENLVLKCGQSRIELLSVLTDGFPSWLSQKPCKYDSIHCGFFVVMPKIRTVKTARTRRREIFEGFFLFEMQSGWRPIRRKKGKAPKRACVGRKKFVSVLPRQFRSRVKFLVSKFKMQQGCRLARLWTKIRGILLWETNASLSALSQ